MILIRRALSLQVFFRHGSFWFPSVAKSSKIIQALTLKTRGIYIPQPNDILYKAFATWRNKIPNIRYISLYIYSISCPKNHWEPARSGVWLWIAGFWDLQTPNQQFWDPMILSVGCSPSHISVRSSPKKHVYILTLTGWGIPLSLSISGFDAQKCQRPKKTWQSFFVAHVTQWSWR